MKNRCINSLRVKEDAEVELCTLHWLGIRDDLLHCGR